MQSTFESLCLPTHKNENNTSRQGMNLSVSQTAMRSMHRKLYTEFKTLFLYPPGILHTLKSLEVVIIPCLSIIAAYSTEIHLWRF